jgi:hypothetical protein
VSDKVIKFGYAFLQFFLSRGILFAGLWMPMKLNWEVKYLCICITVLIMVSEGSEINQFHVTITTNCTALIRCMNAS